MCRNISGYLFTGGAHGMPRTRYMVIDRRDRGIVEFHDMLIEGREEAFHDVLVRVHRRWLEEIGEAESFTELWPLTPSENIAPMEDGVSVVYNVYEIVPYAAGQPELRISCDELEKILKPRYLP